MGDDQSAYFALPTWSAMAALPSIRDYHSVALLLPSGQVAMAVTHQTDTEQKMLELPFIRTGFSTFGTIVTNGAVTDRFGVGNNFDALTFASGNHGFGPNLFYYLRRDITGLTLTAPDGSTPHSLIQQGYYMLFALNNNGAPSIAIWLYVH